MLTPYFFFTWSPASLLRWQHHLCSPPPSSQPALLIHTSLYWKSKNWTLNVSCSCHSLYKYSTCPWVSGCVWLGKRSYISCGGKKTHFKLLPYCTDTYDKCCAGKVVTIMKKYNEDDAVGNQGMPLKKWLLNSNLRDEKRKQTRDLRKRKQHVWRPCGTW